MDTAAGSADADRLLEASVEREEQRTRSLSVAMAVTGVAITLVVLMGASSRLTQALGELTPARGAVLVLVPWAAFILTSVCFHTLGTAHGVTQVLRHVDLFMRSLALSAALVLSGSAAVLFLVATLVRGYSSTPRPAWLTRRLLFTEVTASVVAIAGCLSQGRLGAAALLVQALMAFGVAHATTAPANVRTFRARIERDAMEKELLGTRVTEVRGRIARELHDGVGADVTALVLHLRRLSTAHPTLTPLVDSAQDVLDELRAVVLSLRSEDTHVRELTRLIETVCRRIAPALGSVKSFGQRKLSVRTIIAAVNAAKELARTGTRSAGQVPMSLSLSLGAHVQLALDIDGASLTPTADTASLRELLNSVGGDFELVAPGALPGLRLLANIPFEDAS